MNDSNLDFHHFGLAVRRPEEARTLLSLLGYEPGDAVFDPRQNVHLQLCTHKTQPAVEVIWPGDTRGPIDKLLNSRPAGVIYHLCYETDDLLSALSGLEAAGLHSVCILPPTPALLFGGRNVSFYNVVGIGLIEIVE